MTLGYTLFQETSIYLQSEQTGGGKNQQECQQKPVKIGFSPTHRGKSYLLDTPTLVFSMINHNGS